MLRHVFPVLGLMLTIPAAAAPAARGTPPAPPAETARVDTAGGSFIRVQDDDDSGRVSLQIAARTFRRGPTEPAVTLVGASHIGQPAYYDTLQKLLDSHDLVLFEGVGPIWARLGPDASPLERISTTRERLRILAIAIESRRRAGDTPDSLDDLLAGRGYEDRLLRIATRDGWGRPIHYTHDETGFGLISLGADGTAGGEGADADITLNDLPPLLDEELGTNKGIQSSLADATGLVFQLDTLDYDKPNWRNSDTTAEALAYAMAGLNPDNARPGDGAPRVGGAGNPLFDLMRGEGMLGRFAGGMLKVLGASPRSRAMLRLMMIETLAHADDLMGMDVEGLDRMMNVLLEQRNEIVLEDLRREIDRPGERPASIAVFYGAGHLGDLGDALERMGYRPTSTTWIDAVTVDPAETGLSPQQMRGVRAMIDSMLAARTRADTDGQPPAPRP